MSSKGTEKIKKNSASKAVAIRIFKNPMAIVGILLVIILCFAAVFARGAGRCLCYECFWHGHQQTGHSLRHPLPYSA